MEKTSTKLIAFVIALCGFITQVAAQSSPGIGDSYTLVSKKRVGRTLYEYTFRAEVTNTGTAVTDVSATVSSSSPNTTIIDGEISFNDLAANASEASIDTFSFRQDRRHAFDPKSLSWLVSATPVAAGPSIDIASSPGTQSISIGAEKNITSIVSFDTQSADEFTIEITQAITPAVGLTVQPVINGVVQNTDQTLASTYNQVLTGSAVGEYQITTTATISETGETSESTVVVEIVPNSASVEFIVNTPAAAKSSLQPNAIQNVFFTVQVHGLDEGDVSAITMQDGAGTSLFSLADNGMGGDINPNDLVFSGVGSINTNGLGSGDCLSFQAMATTAQGNFLSEPHQLCVSQFQPGFVQSNMSPSNLIPAPDSGSGQQAVANELVLAFAEGVDETRMVEIAATLNGSIVGSLIDLNLYQLQFAPAAASAADLQALIDQAQAFPEVEFAEPNAITSGGSVVPSDVQFSNQTGVKKIRADEAWYIARGKSGVTIAIVDSGADLDHPDLDGKVIKGTDFIGTGDPDDEHGHGTHVAGIAGAETDNGLGVAGVSWNGKLLIVRVLDKNNSGTLLAVVSGIRYAANQGARIINLSLESSSGKKTICAATANAQSKGALLVAAAGNQGTSSQNYPAACANVLAVGNTTNSDTRNSSSSFGSWVDLAAPGTNILSTVPVGGTCAHCTTSGYKRLSGTSQAAPMVAGAAAVILSRQSITNNEIIKRLKQTAVELPGLKLGSGRIDLFEAVFNGSFEEGNLALWVRNGTTASFEKLGSLTPPDRKRMGYVSTGPAASQSAGSLVQTFQVQDGVNEIPLSFKYAFISEEFPEFVGTAFNDSLTISLVAPNGVETVLASEEINSSAFSIISGLDFPGGDNTVGWTGWKTISVTIPVTSGSGSYQIKLSDAGDEIYDTVLLIDAIKFEN